MNKYLLLRDNKQTGPHSYEEMLALGFRKYDLVWVEGKSAAWRYPGEINEFKELAPLVEEQPYDRFFKRKAPEEQVAGSRLQAAEQVAGGRLPEQVTGNRLQVAEESAKEQEAEGLKREDVEKRRVALVEKIQKQEDSKYLPKEKTESAAEHMAHTAERHRKVAITMPASRKSDSTPTIKPQPRKQEPRPEPRYIPVPANLALAQEKQEEKPVAAPFTQLPQQTSNSNWIPYLQYAGVAAALISLVVIGILIGMSINNDPVPSRSLVSEPPRITELKEKLSATPIAEPIPAVSQVQTVESHQGEYKQTTAPVKRNAVLTDKESQTQTSYNTSSAPPPSVKDEKREAVKRSTPVNAESSAESADISKQVAVSLNNYKVNIFGGIDNIEVSVTNNAVVKVDEVVVELRYILSNKRKNYLTETLTFQDLKPGQTKTLQGPKSSRGIKLESYIVSAR
ncbi:MAG TPA: hypothetical protein VK166_06485 [Chitinophagaceae bacterium]|nr:hypothetical protein [Chitinophagaceae bacterium]